MIKQEKPLTLNVSLVGTGRELTLHERDKKKRERQLDNLVSKPDITRTARRSLKEYFEKDLTFAPKLNEQSIKLAEERMARMIHEQSERDSGRAIECQKICTFKPQVSPASLKIVQNLGTTFLARQQLHIERKQKLLEEAQRIPIPLLHRPKKQSKLVTSFSAFPPEDSCKIPPSNSSSEYGGGSNNERLCLPPCPSTPTLTQNSNSEEVLTAQSSLKQQHSADNIVVRSHVEKTQVSFKQSISPQEYRSFHKTLTKNTPIVQPPVTKSPSDKKGNLIRRQKQSPNNFEQEVLRLKRLKVKAEGIMRAKKVFVVQGPYRSVRTSMRRRGWVEQMYKGPYGDVDTSNNITKSPVKKNNKSKVDNTSSDDSSDSDSDSSCSDSDTELSDEEDYCILSRAVKNSLPFFIWTCKRDDFFCRNLRKDQVVNHFDKAASLTTKVGLYANLQNLPWFGDVDPNTFFPRCYRLCNQEEKHAFIDDYRLTAAISLLKVLINQLTSPCSSHNLVASRCSTPHNYPPSRPQSRPSSQLTSSRRSTPTAATHRVVPEVAFSLAIQAAEYFVGFEEHNDIDSETSLCPPLSDSEWDTLVSYHHDAIFNNCQFICSSSMAARAKMLLVQLKQHLPQLTMDGMRNVWILKPGAKSRGRGISCFDRLEDILAVVSNPVQMKESKWIIQKYIETPLLIYDTKFDIRQWFLVTDWNPLTMWMYKDCYLRFCTQQFNLEDLDISIHLANNCIQKNFTNSPTRSNQLPTENMWDCEQFKKFLSSIGASPNHWENVIYTGMKDALINALQVTQDDIDYQRNAFELYGADFMITTDLKPWLIEINCSPSMSYSTSITKRLCKAVQEDTIKVVFDRKLDKNCDTGDFEMVYKQQKLGIPSYVGVQLCVEGFSVKRISGSGSRTTRPELTRSQTPKMARQELSLRGTKFRTRSQAGYRENIEA